MSSAVRSVLDSFLRFEFHFPHQILYTTSATDEKRPYSIFGSFQISLIPFLAHSMFGSFQILIPFLAMYIFPFIVLAHNKSYSFHFLLIIFFAHSISGSIHFLLILFLALSFFDSFSILLAHSKICSFHFFSFQILLLNIAACRAVGRSENSGLPALYGGHT
jgi:hypothetical protein